MKNLLICTRILHLIFLLSFGVLMVNCEEVESPNPITQPTPTPTPDPDPEPDPEEPALELKVPAVVIRINRQVDANLRISGIKEAVITIRKDDGTLTEYEMKRIQVEEQDGYYLTEKIFLPEGSYEVVAFYILGEGNAVMEATPQKTSSLSEDPALSLPIPFEIVPIASDAEDEPVSQLPMNAISVEGKSPKDFGFQSFNMDVKSPVSFYVTLVSDAHLMDFISGTLQITANGEIFDLDLIEGINQTMILPYADEYTVKASAFLWFDFIQTFTFEELQIFKDNPLLIELEENLCIGGKYVGNVVLSSQTEVNNWVRWCYEGIEGNLHIQGGNSEDPVVDLTSLSGLKAIEGQIIITNTNKLVNLDGLKNIASAVESVQIYNNQNLEQITGLSGIIPNRADIIIQNNPSMISLDGLGGFTELGKFQVYSNQSLKNFRGLENLKEVDQLTISANSSLESFNGLSGLRKIGSLTINDQIQISSFEGFGAGVEQINRLSIHHMTDVRNLHGLLAPSGKILSEFDLFATSLVNLDGLALADEMLDIKIDLNGSLDKLTQLSNVTKVSKKLTINSNSLRSLDGLQNLVFVGDGTLPTLEIRNNQDLMGFCALKNLFENGVYHKVLIQGNYYNPTIEKIISGECQGDY
ncbi:receptor L domain-containing protein [Lunatibacter salilacus]|uniref:hypothetical protein n=1 Tax=Lunatibacter salilacus TaxID=2483804 RepID=UPI00131E4F8D|nr:hypothetical protein [Lunatibacter salilacus]